MPTVLVIVVLALAAAVAAYAVLVEPNWLRVRRRVLHLHGWPEALGGFTVLHVSDPHVRARPGRSERSLKRAARMPADLFVITGDFLAGPRALDRCCAVLRDLTASRTVYAVPGNHEHTEYVWRLPGLGGFPEKLPLDWRAIVSRMEGAGVQMLVNRRVPIARGAGRFALAGVGDLFGGHDDLDAALAGLSPEEPVVLLCHSPDMLAEAARRAIPLVLSGHTHGGQVRIPGLGPITTVTRYPMERPCGVLRRGHTTMHVSPGLGTTFLPVRFLVRPEITVLELWPSNAAGAGDSGRRASR